VRLGDRPSKIPGQGIGGQIGLLLFDGTQLGSETTLLRARQLGAAGHRGDSAALFSELSAKRNISAVAPGTSPPSCGDGRVSVPQGTAPRTSRY
jgi:hypothetical protein